MLEKYRKLANDAHLNGDRVNAEYYLQFADHYFRVMADTRVRQEEQRLRRDDRWQEGDGEREESDESAEFGVESEFPAFDQPPVYTRREREDRPERAERPERAPDRVVQDRPQSQDSRRRDERPAPEQQGMRAYGRNSEQDQPPAQIDEQASIEQNAAGDNERSDARTTYEPAENPFLRENRSGRGLRPRREDRRPRREDRPEVPGETQATDRATRAIAAGIDPETLPPSFTVPRDEPPIVETAAVDAVAAEKPARRPRAKRKPVADDTGEPIQPLI